MTRTVEGLAPPPARTPAPTPPPAPPPAPAQQATPQARYWPRTAALVAGAMAVLVAGGAVLAHGTEPTGNRYQSVGYTGEHPFTSPVGADESVSPTVSGGTRRGDTAGLYQQDPHRPACDGAALRTELTADPARVRAWAATQRVSPAGLSAYVDGLHPVVLRADTAVVDHGYRDGGLVDVPVVLAAGTAVFVDGHGRPAVKCLSGNPLTPGTSTDASVTTIVASPGPLATLTVLDPVVERLVDRPVRSAGSGREPGDVGR